MLGAMASLIGSGVSSAANLYSNELAFERQKALNKQKYSDMISFAKANGATPSSIIQGITGSAGGTVPTVSTSNNPVSDFGSTFNNAVTADASQKQAVAAQRQSAAALTNAETERQLALMKLKFEPGKYFADIKKSLAEAFESYKNAFLHGSMRKYYDELTIDVRQVRPWKIAGLRQGLLNDMATFGKILQETSTGKAQESYYYAGANELNTRSDFNKAQTQLTYAQYLNEQLKGFRLQWENSLLSAGIDVTKPFWENTARLMYTNPNLFKERMNMFISSLDSIDAKIQANLGEHYKRNALIGYGLYKLNDIHQKNANNRAYRFHSFGSTISSFIPFAGGSSFPAVGVSGPGVDWWLKD